VDPRSVAGALARARRSGAIDGRELRSFRRTLRRAAGLSRRLSGAPRAELAAAIATVRGLAARRQLTPSRTAVAFLTLRRNAQVWARGDAPVPGRRYSFGRDPAVFQEFPGQGLVFHPLASFGRLNALARLCVENGAHSSGCHARRLRRGLDRLLALSSRRGGFTTWEYLVAYAGATPPWISAMAQATAIQALARGARALGVRGWAAAAESALGAFQQPPPTGVRVPTAGGARYAMYSFAPGLQILNGMMQTALGLADAARLEHSTRARRLYDETEPVIRTDVPGYDTGAWSLYSSHGAEAALNYHLLMTRQLANLCAQTRHHVYCRTARSFARYLRQPPALRVTWPRRTLIGDPAPIGFSVSKGSAVRLVVAGNGRTALTDSLRAAAGRHIVAWTPPHPGAYRLRITAVGPEGRRTLHRAALTVKRPPPPRRAPPARHRRPRRPHPQTVPSTPAPTVDATPTPQPTTAAPATPTPAVPVAPPPPTDGGEGAALPPESGDGSAAPTQATPAP
jgi:D-glucuronyl C5-epimerase-like protein